MNRRHEIERQDRVLTPEERIVIEAYRTLTEEQKSAVWAALAAVYRSRREEAAEEAPTC